MPATAKSLGIDQWSVEDRLRLIDEIWEGIEDQEQRLEVPQWHRDELDRRLAAYRADPKAGSSWEEVKARLTAGPGTGR